MDNKGIVSVPVDLLYDGMVVPHDIYSEKPGILLLRQGLTISKSQIEAIKRINGGSDTILVSVKTRTMMLEHKLSCEIANQEELEEETGYTDVKNCTVSLLREVENAHTIAQNKLHDVTDNLNNKLEIMTPDRILDLINALAPADEYLLRHSVDVSLLNGLIGKWLELPKETVDLLIMVGLAHDCGKVATPQQVLNAPRKLALSEFEIMKMHSVHGYELLADFPEAVRSGVHSHHEKCNGMGYPSGILSNDIPLTARVTAISDTYNAMVSRRAYKEPLNPFQIIYWISKMTSADLDPVIVDVFVKNMPKELVGKPVMLSNGEVGAIDSIDIDDLAHPYIRTGDSVVKSCPSLSCVHMYFEEAM